MKTWTDRESGSLEKTQVDRSLSPKGNIYRRDKIFSGHMRFRSSGAAGKSVIRPIHARGCRGADWWDIPD
ncbi:hypothetical protein BDQ94DRAFT_186446 [Aspergillus welwitschiae]|uniref:Uncharacterized protein n=1 Tax=Aspergillus welwitschiae TaxID=1341132 RepID=A0A3F3PJX9_9EURO|nr:hypothetical protein BDQ94DRAFT_186446 [Aspergillus welwitschiae]RDH26676.1 hypothetical protein BDQ94DRAFT_186446 [Aspergillus welwitschiae]